MLLPLKELIRSKRNKPFTFVVNSVGMILAFTVFVVMFAYAYSELNHDRNVKNRKNMVRVERTEGWSSVPGTYGAWLTETLPEVLQFCRLWKNELSVYVPAAEKEHELWVNEDVIFADSSFSTLFSLYFLQGNMWENPDGIVISETMAKHFFGDEEAVGKVLRVDRRMDLVVTGVFRDAAAPGLFRPKMVASVENGRYWTSEHLNHWGGNNFETYLLLRDGCNRAELNEKFGQLQAEKLLSVGYDAERVESMRKEAVLKNYTDLYFNPLLMECGQHGNLRDIRILMLLAFLVLFVSIINYVNIAMAKVADQTRNIGLKRTLGSGRLALMYSIVLEAVITCFVAMVIAFGLAVKLSPVLEQWLGFGSIFNMGGTAVFALLVVLPAVCGILSGFFPAFYLTNMNGMALRGGDNLLLGRLKSGLMVMQFAISFGLIISTLFIFKQLNYVKDLNPGYDRNNVVVVYGSENSGVSDKYAEFRAQLLKYPGILNVGISRDPIFNMRNSGFGLSLVGWEEGENKRIPMTYIDKPLLDVLGIKILEGAENLEGERSLDRKVLINQQMVKKISTLSPRQEHLGAERIAVVNDFNYRAMYEPIRPMCLNIWQPFRGRGYVHIRIAPENREGALAHIKECYSRFYPETYYRYSFMDDDYNRLYGSEDLFARRLIMLSVLSVAIACLGLLAFVVFFIEQRMKSIGIRKVLGATELEIMNLLNRDFLLRLLAGFAISCPVAYYLMYTWMSSFAYRTELSWWIFLTAFGGMLTVALLSVSALTWRAATSNPVESLKSE